jgi:hypothetical protein
MRSGVISELSAICQPSVVYDPIVSTGKVSKLVVSTVEPPVGDDTIGDPLIVVFVLLLLSSLLHAVPRRANMHALATAAVIRLWNMISPFQGVGFVGVALASTNAAAIDPTLVLCNLRSRVTNSGCAQRRPRLNDLVKFDG